MRILITGASGWLGKSGFHSMMKMYPNAELFLAASSNKKIQIGRSYYEAIDLASSELLSVRFDGIIHLAFLTRDKIAAYGTENYIQKNTLITNSVVRIIENSKPDWLTTVSSGAAIKYSDSLEENPYTICKINEERILADLSRSIDSNFSVGRLWGSLGLDMPINRNYAVSDFIMQALETREIQVKAKGLVHRKYVDSREFMQVCISSAISGFNDTFESGGQLIEVGELANRIGARLNSKVSREIELISPPDDYYPIDSTYDQLLGQNQTPETDFSTSLEATINGHIEQNLI